MKISDIDLHSTYPQRRRDEISKAILHEANSLRDIHLRNPKPNNISIAKTIFNFTEVLLSKCIRAKNTRKDSSSNRTAIEDCYQIFSVLSEINPSILDENLKGK